MATEAFYRPDRVLWGMNILGVAVTFRAEDGVCTYEIPGWGKSQRACYVDAYDAAWRRIRGMQVPRADGGPSP